MADARNRPDSKSATDTWLTPRTILDPLGEFDLDPCCPPNMPWRTAKRMVSLPEDGLAIEWHGRVYVNPPWSDPLPWIRKMHHHKDGIWLSPAKSTDTKWGQLVLASCDAVFFPAGRPLFHYPDGSPSTGKWTPVMLAAWKQHNIDALYRLQLVMPGSLFINTQTPPP